MSSRAQILSSSNLRIDSRLPLELRSINFQILPSPPLPISSFTGQNTSTSECSNPQPPSGADGYAFVSHGLTKVSSSVFGPREPMRTGPFSGGAGGGGGGGGGGDSFDKAAVNVEVGVAGWSERFAGGSSESGIKKSGKDRRTVELSASLKATFEPILQLHLYPRSSIDIYIQILQVDGALLQASINATTLALISAGLPLTDYVCSLSLASYPSSNSNALQGTSSPPFTLSTPSALSHYDDNAYTTSSNQGSGSTTLLDLTQQEEQSLPNLTLAILPRSGKITLCQLESRVGLVRFEEMLKWGIEGGKVLQGAMETAVKEWSDSLALPSKHLASLFPGIAGHGKEKSEDASLTMEE